ncbi:MAG: hypothetical protein Q9167_003404 [Letrouitia subvulpina]
MATVKSSVGSKHNSIIDIDAIWREAIDRYEAITSIKIKLLAGASNVDDILNGIRERETAFKGFRHDGSKLDKFRTLVSKSLDTINKLGEMIASTASMHCIFTAVRYLIDVCYHRFRNLNKIKSVNSVSADYDKIAGFFEDLYLYLNRLKTLEKYIPPIVELKEALAKVLTSVLVLCGIAAKYVKVKRFVDV